MDLTILQGDCREKLRELPDESVHCCVTSPPYFGLRDYGVDGQIGHEPTPEEYVSGLVEVFREVRRVLRDDGTFWLVIGDNYWGSWQNYGGGNRGAGKQRPIIKGSKAQNPVWDGLEGYRPAATQKHPILKPKDLIGIPWRVALALQADGWWLRSDIIWSKPNPNPESMEDRCTKAHEYIFMLTKSADYFYDHKAIKEPAVVGFNGSSFTSAYDRVTKPGLGMGERTDDGMRNKRSVWTVPTRRYPELHFATYPPELITPCIMAGCPARGVVLDPFAGSGTTGEVALKLGCSAILIELNPEYVPLIEKRCHPHRQSLFDGLAA